MKFNLTSLLCFFWLIILTDQASAQQATISEERRMIKTYAFDTPNPVPILTDNPKIYPYFKFDGYSHKGEEQEWKVVKLENEYITVYVLPQIGGKLWGAVERKTGEEFLYRNEVIKFRNIAMRGPWTSGGVEFNFGIIGHTPATATPVDYKISKNQDGSVSCTVGTIDLPSRTQWRVEIKLEADKAFFETNATWYNPTPLSESYYNWMTGAAVANDDLEFFIPGDQYLEHGGDAHPWPIDKNGRKLSNYKDNDFGPHKSYHVVGDYKDFFGGYYHDKRFGFGHWATYEEMPGQKLWLWALSRSGGVWEDLLTDTDGQYIEFQAGRLLNQYFPESGNNSITQANFEPHVMDRWREIWFPFKEIGGMEAASEWGVLNVEYGNGNASIGLNALQYLDDEISITVNGIASVTEKLTMKPMDIFIKEVKMNPGDKLEIVVGNRKIHYSNDEKATKIDRPFNSQARTSMTEVQTLYFEAWEAMKYRDYEMAARKFLDVLKLEPLHQDALVKLAELEYRKANYEVALVHVNKVLELDTYHPEANYKAGIIYRAMKSYTNALESFGWAARSMTYRSVSYAQMAEIHMRLGDGKRAKELSNKALDFNRFNINARYVLAVQARNAGQKLEHKSQIKEILLLDPLNHFAENEKQISSKSDDVLMPYHNEFPSESNLELALQYYNLGLHEDAIEVLEKSEAVKNKVWLAFLLKDSDTSKSKAILETAIKDEIDYVLPYRRESIDVFNWANNESNNWKLTYYLALNYYAIGRKDTADQLLENCAQRPNSEVFYRFRAQMLKGEKMEIRLRDYDKAFEINDEDWKLWEEAIQLNLEAGKKEIARELAEEAVKRYPENYNTSLVYAKSLFATNNYAESLRVLENIEVLPSELARESRKLFYESSVLFAEEKIKSSNFEKAIDLLKSSKQWPENLGVGKPYSVDERLQDYLLSHSYSMIGNEDEMNQALGRIIDFSEGHESNNQLLYLLALKKLGKTEILEKVVADLEQSENIKHVETMTLYNNEEMNKVAKADKMTAMLKRIMQL